MIDLYNVILLRNTEKDLRLLERHQRDIDYMVLHIFKIKTTRNILIGILSVFIFVVRTYFFIFRSFSSHLLLYLIFLAYFCLTIYIHISYFYFLQEKRKNAVAVRTDDRMISYDRKEGWKNTHTHTHTHTQYSKIKQFVMNI